MKDGHINYCSPCRYDRYHRDKRKTDHHWGLQLKWKFGIELEEYTSLLEEQGGVCAICKEDNRGKRLCVDHCHETEKIRGLLCTGCNKAIGQLGDTSSSVYKAYEYLLKAEGEDTLDIPISPSGP